MNKYINYDFKKNVEHHVHQGVHIIDPDNTYIENDVKIGKGTTIYPGSYIHKGSSIGENCIIFPNCRLDKAIIHDNVVIESSVLLDCTIGEKSTVGPFAYIRPGTTIGKHCRIGNFVEVKNSNIKNNTSAAHLTYIGDGDVGENVNIGCGAIFVNYDGKDKHRSTVENDAFIGCNSNLIAPAHIGEKAYIAAGSTVTEQVPPKALYIARSKGVIKLDWVSKTKNKK